MPGMLFAFEAKRLPRVVNPLHQNPCIQKRQGCWDIRVDFTRLKVELGTDIGIVIADGGLLALWFCGFSSCRLTVVLLLLSLIVAAYLAFLEAPDSHKLLATARTKMLEEIRIVKAPN